MRIYAIGTSDLIFDEEKSLQETDIVLSVFEVDDASEWPVTVKGPDMNNEVRIKHSEWVNNITEINGTHTVSGGSTTTFPYSFVKDDPRIHKKFQRQIILERIRIGDDVYFVDDMELRRCSHPNLMKVKTERAKSGSLFNLIDANLGEGESLICTECNSVVM